VFAAVAIHPSSAVSEDSAPAFGKPTAGKVQILIVGLYYLIA
jgi:hypothetical protein